MSLFLDHLFVITQPKAAVGDRLLELGLREGPSNTHPGQGTANRRFFFDGFLLELLFIVDKHEAAHGAGRRLKILERSRSVEASPFGLITRSKTGHAPTFASWQYFPDYFSDDMCFYVGENSEQLIEPLCICMPPALPMPPLEVPEYANRGLKLTSLNIATPVLESSATLLDFETMEKVHIHNNKPHHARLQFNHGAEKKSFGLAPDLPLTLAW